MVSGGTEVICSISETQSDNDPLPAVVIEMAISFAITNISGWI